MPVQPTYPGVYIEEINSGVQTILGVATSITAFVGCARSGELDKPVVINSFADFQRLFGGMWDKSMMSYAVKNFYMNGGSRAIIVRVANKAKKATIELPSIESPLGNLVLEASSEGYWANSLRVSVSHQTKYESDPANADKEKYFNLVVTDGREGGSTEKFVNVSTLESDPRYVARVLEQGSMLVRVNGTVPAKRPASTSVDIIDSPPQDPVRKKDIPILVLDANKGSDGIDITNKELKGNEINKKGIYALKNEEFNLLCIPPPTRDLDTDSDVYVEALNLCVNSRAMLIVDPRKDWATQVPIAASKALAGFGSLNLSGDIARNAALFFPRIRQSDSERDGQIDTFVPCGLIAGIMARTDSSRGVWKSPAGIDASLNGIHGLEVNLSDQENGMLNPVGINCLRTFPVTGHLVWGTRTLRGADELADDYKYIAVRRTALFIESSLYRGTKWVVFEPNDESLWAQIRLNVGGFMHDLFRQGAFQGTTSKEAYFVKCDKDTTTQNDINSGIVNIMVGFQPLKPAEFVMLKIQQMAGQIES